MKALSIEDLKALPEKDWVWIIDFEPPVGFEHYSNFYARKTPFCGVGDRLELSTLGVGFTFYYSDYGIKWLAYKNKEQAEAKEKIKMDKEKKLVQKVLEDAHYFCGGDNSCAHCNRICHEFAVVRQVVKAGYGNVKQAVKEFAENKVKPLIDELVELVFNDNESTCRVKNCEKPDDIPCGCSICIEENKQVWKRKLDNLITELYGADEKE